jgi:signal transduction histidine kinase
MTAVGAVGLAGTLVYALGGPVMVSERLVVLALVVLLPTALALYPDGRPPPALGAMSIAVVVASGLVAVVWPELYAESGLAPFVAYLLVLALQWWRVEHVDTVGRRPIVWLALGTVPGPILVFGLGFVSGAAEAPMLVVAVVVGLVCLAVGLVSPEVRDVRSLTVSVVVHLVAALLVVTVYAMILAGLIVLAGHEVHLSPGAYGLLAAICATGYAPTTRLLRSTFDLLLFGDRRDPLETVSRAGEHIDDPVLALRSLRESLLLPYAALLDGSGDVLAATGTPPETLTSVPLSAVDPTLGRLDVGLRPGELALATRDRVVLDVLAPALAQVVLAQRLSAEVRASRAQVVLAVEEERRRLRRDLHDGIGPRLTALAYTADAAQNILKTDPEGARRLVAELRADAAQAIAEIRLLVEGLRPPSLDQVGLEKSLQQHARHLLASDGRPLEVRVAAGGLPSLSAAVEVTAYRIVVEALTNAARHSSAAHVDIRLRAEQGTLCIEVTDDGGATPPWAPGIGLTSMRERVDLLGGQLTAGATPSGGAVCARLRLSDPDPAAG